jgi:hypothetical protein
MVICYHDQTKRRFSLTKERHTGIVGLHKAVIYGFYLIVGRFAYKKLRVVP